MNKNLIGAHVVVIVQFCLKFRIFAITRKYLSSANKRTNFHFYLFDVQSIKKTNKKKKKKRKRKERKKKEKKRKKKKGTPLLIPREIFVKN